VGLPVLQYHQERGVTCDKSLLRRGIFDADARGS
jgi:hypothetical protein